MRKYKVGEEALLLGGNEWVDGQTGSPSDFQQQVGWGTRLVDGRQVVSDGWIDDAMEEGGKEEQGEEEEKEEKKEKEKKEKEKEERKGGGWEGGEA